MDQGAPDKPHENPAIGLLLCASKDNEVVEYALSRSASPALIAEYQTQLPDKRLLQAKLHELYQLSASEVRDEPASGAAASHVLGADRTASARGGAKRGVRGRSR